MFKSSPSTEWYASVDKLDDDGILAGGKISDDLDEFLKDAEVSVNWLTGHALSEQGGVAARMEETAEEMGRLIEIVKRQRHTLDTIMHNGTLDQGTTNEATAAYQCLADCDRIASGKSAAGEGE